MTSALQDQSSATAQFSALVSGCGFYDLSSRAKISLTGSDRARWLNGMVTNNIRDLKPGHGVYAFLLNPQGHILGDLYAYHRGESLLLDVGRAHLEKILATFDHYIIMDDVEVVNLSESLASVGISGPNARAVLQTLGIDVSSLEPLQTTELQWQQAPITIVHSDNPAVETYELWLAPTAVSALQDALSKAGAAAVDAATLDLLRIASGMPKYGQDIRERDLPQETEQAGALNFSKGCYVGQEIVERIRSRGGVHRKFTGFLIEGPLPTIGAKIQSDGKDVGEVTSVASLPFAAGEQTIALGYVRKEATLPGKFLQSGDSKLTATNLPFSNAFKN